MIYEGTNEIQAIDLLVRKVLPDGGAAFGAWLDSLVADLDLAVAAHARVLSRVEALRSVTQRLCAAAQKDAALPYWVADDFLRGVAVLLLDWAWARIGLAAPQQARWQQPLQAMERWIAPELQMRLGILSAALDAQPAS
jgi:hypothetical protein